MIELTKEEKSAIASLKRLAKKWPKSLWLYSGSGSLYVMKLNDEGKMGERTDGIQGIDPNFIVDSIIGISNDGGDW